MKQAARIVAELPVRPIGPIAVVYGESLTGAGGAVHAMTDVRGRRIVLDRQLRAEPLEFRRILIHELFHLAWPRLGNPRRRAWELGLLRELEAGARGELGWSAHWRKRRLTVPDRRNRTPRWRDYACESFCDTAAWLWAGLEDHDEYSLGGRFRNRRKRWFAEYGAAGFPV